MSHKHCSRITTAGAAGRQKSSPQTADPSKRQDGASVKPPFLPSNLAVNLGLKKEVNNSCNLF